MTFNQQLIAKARKGEIAILNDGSVQELDALVEEIWPGDFPPSKHALANKYFIAHPNDKKVWYNTYEIEIPAHSVKDFFLPDTKTDAEIAAEISLNSLPIPRTYKVTRQQMKEIWEASHEVTKLMALMNSWFNAFENEVEIGEDRLMELRRCFNQREPEVLKKYFPSYFHIPEGEPVLVRQKGKDWFIRVSDGKGKAYDDAQLSGHSTLWDEIIPFTKNPPK